MAYSKDPYWTEARFNSKCKCGATITKGDRIFYYPIGHHVLGSKCRCADKAQNDFRNCVEAERYC